MTNPTAGSPFHRAWGRLGRVVHKTRTSAAGSGLDGQERLLSRILETPPIATEALTQGAAPSHPIGIHVLGHDAHRLLALWALKSFYHFAGIGFPLTVHLQGHYTGRLSEVLGQHFPQARLVTQDEADAVVEPWLETRGLDRLLAMRREFFLMMKLIDLRLFARTPFVVSFDTDVLFFRQPQELLALNGDGQDAPGLFMRDCCPSYCISLERAKADLEIDLAPFANAGLMRLATDNIDLEACDRYLAHPDLARPHWHLEQTLHALYASAQGRVQLLPDGYLLAEEPHLHPERLIARHYTSPIRPLLVGEGVTYLLNTGFLPALADSAVTSGLDRGP